MRLLTALLLTLAFFCSAHAAPEKSIGIFTYKAVGVKPWDPDSIQSGITGSEEAVIYISQSLAKLGFQVTVFGSPPLGSRHSLPEANPRFVDVDTKEKHKFDVAISWRIANRAAQLRKIADKVYFWPHDSAFYALSEEQISGFDDVLWLSQWQRAQWISVNPPFAKFTKVFGNGIVPEQFLLSQEKKNPYACIYGSNYGQGLEVLLDIWPTIKHRFPLATLDIYYGWQHWNYLSPQQETKMRKQVQDLASMGVSEHGQVGHEELNRAYEKSSLWTYPCMGTETFCITALRAQLAGNLPVIIDGSALKETVQHGFKCARRDDYCITLMQAMQYAETLSQNDRKQIGEFVLQEYTWDVIATKWKGLFESNVHLQQIAMEH